MMQPLIQSCGVSDKSSERVWYAIRTRAQHEKAVRDRLVRLGVEQLLPTYSRISHWHDRRKLIESPLFPGYCFARIGVDGRIALLQVPGVVYIVGREGCPEAIPDQEIDSLMKLMHSGLIYEPQGLLAEGDTVQVMKGPLIGLRGRLIRKERNHYLLLGVKLINQGATVRIDPQDVIRIGGHSGSTRSLEHSAVV